MWTSPLQGEWLALRVEQAQAVQPLAAQAAQQVRLTRERWKQA